MNPEIIDAAARRGITRLCHFTPSRHLHTILNTGVVLATRHLQDDARAVYHPTDLERLDGYTSHVCCSIEYPNAWFFQKARDNQLLYQEWVILFINSYYLGLEDTGLCPRNAAAAYGTKVTFGTQAFESLFTSSVVGSGGRTFTRSSSHLPSCPTDNQAEVLISDRIPLKDVFAIGVSTDDQAQTEYYRLRMLGHDLGQLPFVVTPACYNPGALKAAVTAGRRPEEHLWQPATMRPGHREV